MTSEKHVLEWLQVPFMDKEEAKALAPIRWDTLKKQWYIPIDYKGDLEILNKWRFKSLQVKKDKTQSHPELNIISEIDSASLGYKQNFNITKEGKEVKAEQHLTLSQLLGQVKAQIQAQFSNSYWVKAEIGNISKNDSGHIYLELVEYANDNNQKNNNQIYAKSRANIWRNLANSLQQKFYRVTNSELKNGIQILVNVSINFHEVYGISLNIIDIEPSFTLGEMQKRLHLIRQQLQAQNLYHANRQLELPKFYQNIAVISPNKAAGLNDFMVEADRLEKIGITKFFYFSCEFQGDNITNKFVAQIQAAQEIENLDLLVVIRGGGSAIDLGHLNNQEIAIALAQCPMPVLTGIGHSIDSCILDEIVTQSFDTPSKLISYIKDKIITDILELQNMHEKIINSLCTGINQTNISLNALLQRIYNSSQSKFYDSKIKIEESYLSIVTQSKLLINSNKQSIQNLRNIIYHQSQLHLRNAKDIAQNKHSAIYKTAEDIVNNFKNKLNSMGQILRLVSPEQQLKKGFAIVKSNQGIITNLKQLKQKCALGDNEQIYLKMADGEIKIKPLNKE